MTEQQAKRLVVVSVVVAALLASVAELSERKLPGPRVAIGLFFAAVLLALLAEVAPQLAGGMAALLLTSAVLTLGPTVLKAANRTVS